MSYAATTTYTIIYEPGDYQCVYCGRMFNILKDPESWDRLSATNQCTGYNDGNDCPGGGN